MVPVIEALARAGSGAAARLLSTMAPDRARPIILADLKALHPRFPVEVSGALLDESTSGLDAPLLRQLRAARTRRELSASLARIARHATPSLLPAVMRIYLVHPAAFSCEVAPPALAYFFRADPASAKAIVSRVRSAPPAAAEGCDGEWPSDLLERTAARGWSTGLERYALEMLAGDDHAAVAMPAATLSSYGRAAHKTAVLDALDLWRTRWTPANVEQLGASGSLESALEDRLMRTIADSRAWRFQPDDLARLRAGCRFSSCAQVAGELERRLPEAGEEPRISVYFDATLHALTYFLETPRLTLDQLERRIAAFPAGTSFHWGTYLDAVEAWYLDVDERFRRVEAVLARHGMTLGR